MAMYGSKAFELVKELERTKDANLPPFDVSLLQIATSIVAAMSNQKM